MNESSRSKRNKKNILHLAAFLVIALLVFVLPFVVLAIDDPNKAVSEEQESNVPVQGGAFEVTDYDLTAVVEKDHSYAVEEKISVNIPDRLKSVEFAIPSGNFRIDEIEVENALYEAKTASEASRVVISDPEKLTKGSHVYTIKYRIREYRDRDSSKDMFFFNVLLPEWKQPIGKVSINVSFPDDFPFDDMQCYAGQFGVQDSTNKIRTKVNRSSHSVSVRGELIPENFGITLKAQLPDGYWQNTLDGSWSITAVTLMMTGLTLILLILWFIGGRDPRVKKEIVTKPVEDLTPVELGYIFNGEVRTKDVLNLLLQFAQKGYLTISEYEPKRYRLIRGKTPVNEERMYRNAFRILFEDVYKNRPLSMDKIGPRVEKIRTAITDDVAAGFTTSESLPFTPISRVFRAVGAALLGIVLGLSAMLSYYYNYRTPNYVEAILIAVAGAAAALLFCKVIDDKDSSSAESGRYAELLASMVFALPVIYTVYRVVKNTGKPYVAVPMIIASVVAEFLIVIMRARGKENAVIVNKVRRLRHFISHPTPKEVLENHLADSNYYYDMLLYALAFGSEEAWAISFLTLDVPEPEWYSDDIEGHAFSNLRLAPTTIDYARDLRSFIRTFDNN
ncbi:MAG: DUF2207 domain-containing protein [Mogibacterium sp.]|nr:DUF2207 domain-containing protein [Mogibacterium sp.]